MLRGVLRIKRYSCWSQQSLIWSIVLRFLIGSHKERFLIKMSLQSSGSIMVLSNSRHLGINFICFLEGLIRTMMGLLLLKIFVTYSCQSIKILQIYLLRGKNFIFRGRTIRFRITLITIHERILQNFGGFCSKTRLLMNWWGESYRIKILGLLSEDFSSKLILI